LVILADVLKKSKDEVDKAECDRNKKREGLLLVQKIKDCQQKNVIAKRNKKIKRKAEKKKLSKTYVL